MKQKKIKKNGLPLTHFKLFGMHCVIRGSRTLFYSLFDWHKDNELKILFGR